MSAPQASRPGTYAVVLRPQHPGPVKIGRLGTLVLDNRVFIYVGSALGPGGVAARCRHHQRIAARPHWHLDYLRPHCEILRYWVAYGTERREHDWAQAVGELADARWPLAGFGSSECDCPAHLIGLDAAPDAEIMARTLAEGAWWIPDMPSSR
jgi:Uri superfamily endonuclease